jgi:hypothetical protein
MEEGGWVIEGDATFRPSPHQPPQMAASRPHPYNDSTEFEGGGLPLPSTTTLGGGQTKSSSFTGAYKVFCPKLKSEDSSQLGPSKIIFRSNDGLDTVNVSLMLAVQQLLHLR